MMTVREILSAMLRRWYIPVGLLVCAALVTLTLARDGGSYTTRTVVSFLLPSATMLAPYNGTNDSSVIAFAGAVVQQVNAGPSPVRYSLAEAPYYGAGVREGVLVQLVDSGNQWVSTFTKADVEIQIVGRSFDWVESTQRQMVDQVVGIAGAQQVALGVHAADRISATVVPLTRHIEQVSASRRDQGAAGAALIVVALILGGWGSLAVDRRLMRRPPTGGSRTGITNYPAPEGTPS